MSRLTKLGKGRIEAIINKNETGVVVLQFQVIVTFMTFGLANLS